MAEKNIGALVVQEGERVVGIFSERDYARQGKTLGDERTKSVPLLASSRTSAVKPKKRARASAYSRRCDSQADSRSN